MHLMYLPVLDANGKPTSERRYTLDKVLDGQVTRSAHPARFSPDDKWSRHRLAMRKRFGPLFEQALVNGGAQTSKTAQDTKLASGMEALKISKEILTDTADNDPSSSKDPK